MSTTMQMFPEDTQVREYSGSHCWQHEIRERNREEDLFLLGNNIVTGTGDFYFSAIDSDNDQERLQIRHFIERHEWLGKMPMASTHRFTARLRANNALAGVVVMATPNTFSHILGKENKELEKLIARGASISWSPKNLGSWLIMKSVNWMVQNTQFRVFTAYSDPTAKELGTIYQACNFIYMGNAFGARTQYFDPKNPARGWFGSTGFNERSQITRYGKELGVPLMQKHYRFVGNMKRFRKINWDAMSSAMREAIKQRQAEHIDNCEKRTVPRKHKYAYVLGQNKRETKYLKKLFHANNRSYQYPKNRGI